MKTPNLTMAQRIGEIAGDLGRIRTGLTPKSVTVVQADGTLVITLNGALSPAEMELAKTEAGAAKVQEFHRELFVSDSLALRSEIERITGVQVCAATAEVEPSSGTVVAVFATGTIVQVFLLKTAVDEALWNAPVTPCA